MTATLHELHKAALAADAAWTAAYQAVCPKGVWPGDFRYTDAAKAGELRTPYEDFRNATKAWLDFLGKTRAA